MGTCESKNIDAKTATKISVEKNINKTMGCIHAAVKDGKNFALMTAPPLLLADPIRSRIESLGYGIKFLKKDEVNTYLESLGEDTTGGKHDCWFVFWGDLPTTEVNNEFVK